MLTAAISKVREFLGSWRNLLALGTLPLLGAWIYSRVWMVNPAILGDEYLYSMNARKVGPWDPPVAGDFSNYLFNLVYQGTNLCGEAFYTCGKVVNIVFFLGFIFTIFIIATRFLPFWGAYAFMIAAGLSPLSVYTSMFLPESMYFFFIGLILVAVLRAMRVFVWQNWALAGAAIGLASLVKPHAWLSAIAVGITMLVVGLTGKSLGPKPTLISGISLVGGAVAARIGLGLLVAGPKALDFFGQYFGISTIREVLGETGTEEARVSENVSTPAQGVLDLMVPQLTIHVLSIASVMALGVIGLLVGVWDLSLSKRVTHTNAFGLFVLIWIGSLVIAIVMFTGWITGSGDDHSTRVLIRYYEFLYVLVPLAGLAILYDKDITNVNVFVRWGVALLFGGMLTQAFAGFFGSLTIQIADAPTLAGLVVDIDVFNSASIVGILSIMVFAMFPKRAYLTFIGILPITMLLTGWQAQDQYQQFRGVLSEADVAGQFIAANFSSEELEATWVIGTSRFEVTNVAIWADHEGLTYDLFNPGQVINLSQAPQGTRRVVVLGGLVVEDSAAIEHSESGFEIYTLD